MPVVVRDDLVYYLLNKPTGYVSTASDPEGRATVVELVPDDAARVPGRAARLRHRGPVAAHRTTATSPTSSPTRSFGVVKTYLAEVEGDPTPATVRALREGVELDDGRTAPARVTVVQRRGETAAVELGIHEGRNRQVRRMCEAVGHPVVRLVRTRIGPLRDGSLKPGTWRALTPAEVRKLYEAATHAAADAPSDRHRRAGDSTSDEPADALSTTVQVDGARRDPGLTCCSR